MKCKSVYEDCKRLVLEGEKIGGSRVSEHMTYMDTLGCDLQVCYTNMLLSGLGEMQESINVYLGGREVYRFYEGRPDKEYIVRGKWEELVPELWRYEFDALMGESYVVNGTLLELCRKEAVKNRKLLGKYREHCSSIVKAQGVLKKSNDRKKEYEFKKSIDGHTIEIYLSERVPIAGRGYWDDVELFVDKKIGFRFYWNCSSTGSIFDNKGKYVPGVWERILEELVGGL